MTKYKNYVTIEIVVDTASRNYDKLSFHNIPTNPYRAEYGILGGSNGLYFYIYDKNIKCIWPTIKIHSIEVIKHEEE
jgi:hypothetical protein